MTLTKFISVLISFLSILFYFGYTSVSYAAVGEIIYHEWGYYRSDSGDFGGPGCGICVKEARKSSRDSWRCVLERPGTRGYFTMDSVCKKIYGQEVVAGANLGSYDNLVNLCGLKSLDFQRIECIIPADAPCAEFKDGVCTRIGTSIFQGGDKDKGNFSTNPSEFVVRVFTIILGFAGGIALLLIIRAGYRFVTSKGKPEDIQQAREQLIAAIIGLVFIIFSFVIFQLVFVDILKIPGFQ